MRKRQGILRLVLAAFTTLAMAIMLTIPFYDGTASAAMVEPEVVEGNPTCGDFTDGGIEFKIEGSGELTPADTGEYTDGLLVVDVTIRHTDNGPVFDWETNFGVDVVVAKGGPMANVYRYSPIQKADTGLHSPLNKDAEKYYGLSHISFCYLKVNATTTTTTTTETTSTESKVTSTTGSASTSTEAETTTTQKAPTSTSTTNKVLPTQITATTSPTASTSPSGAVTTSTTLAETLPFTGMSAPITWVLALSMLGAGVTALLVVRGDTDDLEE